jgi:hypothetical protein
MLINPNEQGDSHGASSEAGSQGGRNSGRAGPAVSTPRFSRQINQGKTNGSGLVSNLYLKFYYKKEYSHHIKIATHA